MPIITRLRSGAGKRRNYRSLAGMSTRRRAVPRLSQPVRSAVARVAKRAIKVESKHASTVVVNDTFNNAISSASECYTVMPPIIEGDRACDRQGKRITSAYLYIKGTIQYQPPADGTSDPQLNPATCRLMILEQKNQKDSTQIQARTAVGSLLDPRLGSETSSGYNGSFPSNESPINKELFRVLADKKFRFNWDYQGNFASVGAASGNNLTKHFTVKIKCPKTLLYDPASSTSLPVNFAPFFCFGFCYDTDRAPGMINTPFMVRVLSTCYYKDA